MFRSVMIATAVLFGMPAAAHDHPSLTYADFESSVPHIDMDACPPDLAIGDVFCRITMNNDALHIYVFENDGDSPFVSVHTFYEDEYELTFSQ
ncbi:hypothetical protein [Yoonia sp.]|uniref:hypothetical protein n=1 Tax=Yoonia sp. TaxID=2212373 RepID=UPI00391BA6BC